MTAAAREAEVTSPGERSGRALSTAAPKAMRFVRRTVSTVTRWLRRRVRRRPLLSVVVDAGDDQAVFVYDCMSSLTGQALRDLEVVVVLHGRCEQVRHVFARYAARDDRIRVLAEELPDRATARNAGLAAVRGKYVAFVCASDRVAEAGYERMVRSLEGSWSDFAVGIMQVPKGVRDNRQLDQQAAQGARCTPESVPSVLSDSFVGNRVLRREFCLRHGFEFTANGGLRDEYVTIHATVRSTAFDVIPVVCYLHEDRGHGLAYGTQIPQMPALAAWLRENEAIAVLLSGSRRAGLQGEWLRSLLDGGAVWFVDDTERATDEHWQMLHSALAAYIDTMGEQAFSQVSSENRIKAWLAAADRRDELEEFVAARSFERGNVPTHVQDGRVHARYPELDSGSLPPQLAVCTEQETPLVASLRRLRWSGPAELEVEVWAYIRGVDASDVASACTMSLAEASGAIVGPLPVEASADPDVNRFAADRYHSYEHAVFRTRIDLRLLAAHHKADRGERHRWSLRLQVEARDVVRHGGISHVRPPGSAAFPTARNLDGVKVNTRRIDGREFAIECRTAQAVARSLVVDGRTVRGTIRLPPRSRQRWVRASCGASTAYAPLVDTPDGHAFEIELPQRPVTTEADDRWSVRVTGGRGENLPLSWPASEPREWIGAFEGNQVAAVRTGYGNVAFDEAAGTMCVDRVLFDDDRIAVEGRWLGAADDPYELRLESGAVSLQPVTVDDDGVTVRAAFPTQHESWGTPGTPICSGTYQLVRRTGEGGDARPALAGDALVEQLPCAQITGRFRFDLLRATGRVVAVRVGPPLSDSTLSAYAQKRMQLRALDDDGPVEAGVYFQSYDGRVATDSQAAIHRELRRRGSDLTLYWGVADYATVLPEGAVPLLLKSPEWYERIARVTYLVSNVDFERWHSKRPHQRFLQTFHGYPSKSMGIGLWNAKRFTSRRIRAELDRTSRDWDLAVTPTPEMNQYYRREYDYDGPIFDQGYPRDDDLVAPGADAVRARVRDLLEIREHQTAVLYAPTWRDDVARSYASAPIVSHLDLEAASDHLGPDYVLLMRGHRFHEADHVGGGGARLVDVTDYPEVNDLILASDAAVFDYSSMRFDFALTGRPMIFLVPDLASYAGGARGFLYDYRDTAPGPLLETADEVVKALADLDRIGREHRQEYEEFNRRFNPYQDGFAARRLTDAFFGPRPAGP